MKRTPLKRRSALKRSAARSRAHLSVVKTPAPGEREWKTPRWGRCENCGWIAVVPLHGHHVVARQVLARAGLNQWDERNKMSLCPRCHFEHEYGMENRKIGLEKVPERALAFAVDVLGEDQAAEYLQRHYAS